MHSFFGSDVDKSSTSDKGKGGCSRAYINTESSDLLVSTLVYPADMFSSSLYRVIANCEIWSDSYV